MVVWLLEVGENGNFDTSWVDTVICQSYQRLAWIKTEGRKKGEMLVMTHKFFSIYE